MQCNILGVHDKSVWYSLSLEFRVVRQCKTVIKSEANAARTKTFLYRVAITSMYFISVWSYRTQILVKLCSTFTSILQISHCWTFLLLQYERHPTVLHVILHPHSCYNINVTQQLCTLSYTLYSCYNTNVTLFYPLLLVQYSVALSHNDSFFITI